MTLGEPQARTTRPTHEHDHTAVWTGSEMIVWGGADGGKLIEYRWKIQSYHRYLDADRRHQRTCAADTVTRQYGPAVK